MANIRDMIVSAAQSVGVPVDLALEVATAESGLNPNAVGGSGEIGVFQLLPSSFPGYTAPQLADPQTNITLGVGYLGSLLAEFGDPVAAVAAYNAGPGTVSNAIANFGVGNCPGGYPAWLQGIPASTQAYVQRIFSALSNYTVCVAGVPVSIGTGATPQNSPSVTSAGVPTAAPPWGIIALALAGLVGLWLFF